MTDERLRLGGFKYYFQHMISKSQGWPPVLL